MQFTEGVKLVGAVAGLIALGWQLVEAYWKARETFASYLQLDLNLTKDGEQLTALACLTNRRGSPKTLDYAFLLIGPEREDPAKTGQQIERSIKPGSCGEIQQTDDLVKIRTPEGTPYYLGGCRALIPLPFFHEEQDDVADEHLKHRCSIDLERFDPGAYSVRFFVFPERRWFHRLFRRQVFLRCTQDLFRKQPPRSPWSG